MADVQQAPHAVTAAPPKKKLKDQLPLWAVVAGHIPVHLYGQGFRLIMPYMGISAVVAGALQAIRQVGGGVASMGGGVVTDRYQRLRGHFLGVSLVLMALGYLAVGLVPLGTPATFTLIVVALGLASAMGSFWHPPAVSVLSQQYPERRAWAISLHRSSGTLGDTVAPLIVGVLLGGISWLGISWQGMSWQGILQGATLLTIAIALPVWFYMAKVTGAGAKAIERKDRGFFTQFADTGALFRQPGLVKLLLVAGLRGMGDGGLTLFFPFYLKETLGLSPIWVAVYFALLTALAIVTGPLIGRLSDVWGRKPIIVVVMALSTVLVALMVPAERGLLLLALTIPLGSLMYTVNSLTQAGAMDQAEHLRLEGSIMGIYWGLNAILGAVSPVLLGGIIAFFGKDYRLAFWFAAACYAAGMLVALTLPAIGRGMGRARIGGG